MRKVHLEPEGVELKMAHTADGCFVVVPRLQIHSMVTADMDE